MDARGIDAAGHQHRERKDSFFAYKRIIESNGEDLD